MDDPLHNSCIVAVTYRIPIVPAQSVCRLVRRLLSAGLLAAWLAATLRRRRLHRRLRRQRHGGDQRADPRREHCPRPVGGRDVSGDRRERHAAMVGSASWCGGQRAARSLSGRSRRHAAGTPTRRVPRRRRPRRHTAGPTPTAIVNQPPLLPTASIYRTFPGFPIRVVAQPDRSGGRSRAVRGRQPAGRARCSTSRAAAC